MLYYIMQNKKLQTKIYKYKNYKCDIHKSLTIKVCRVVFSEYLCCVKTIVQ